MNNTLTETKTLPVYEIVPVPLTTGFNVTRDGTLLHDGGVVRYFATRNSARKRISREKRGDFHR